MPRAPPSSRTTPACVRCREAFSRASRSWLVRSGTDGKPRKDAPESLERLSDSHSASIETHSAHLGRVLDTADLENGDASLQLPFELDVLLAVDGLERMLVSPLICEEYASTQSFRLFMTV